MNKIELPVFRKNTAEDYLTAALQTTEWITSNEIVTEDGKYWKTVSDDMINEDASESKDEAKNAELSFFGPTSYYGGSAGIGVYFIRLYEATGDKRWLNEAEKAAEYIIRHYPGRSFYEKVRSGELKGVFGIEGWTIGIFSGPTGGGLFALQLYQKTGDERYLDYAKLVADDLIAVAEVSEDKLHWSREFDLNGDGSFLFFFLALYRETGIQSYIEAAEKFGNYIIDNALEAKEGGVYWNPVNLTEIGFGFPVGTIFPNFYHGTSGIGYLLANLYKESKKEKYLDYAKLSVEYLKVIAVGDEEGIFIPYLYNPDEGASGDIFYLSTCHGPVGTSLVFRVLYEITGDKEYLDWVIKLSKGIIRAGAPERHTPGYWNSYCQCCGSPGVLEHFIEIYELTKDEHFLDYAKKTADILIGDSFFDITLRHRKWYSAWTRVHPWDVHNYTGLYVGAAGCASALLHLYAVEKGIKLTPVFDYVLTDTQNEGIR